MSQTREEQLKKFMEEQKDRVSDSMIQNTEILKLLNSKGQKVFIPDRKSRGQHAKLGTQPVQSFVQRQNTKL